MNAHPNPVAATDAPYPLQVAAWRRLGGNGRTELAAELRRKARLWKAAALRTQHPEWDDERVQRELALIYSRGHIDQAMLDQSAKELELATQCRLGQEGAADTRER